MENKWLIGIFSGLLVLVGLLFLGTRSASRVEPVVAARTPVPAQQPEPVAAVVPEPAPVVAPAEPEPAPPPEVKQTKTRRKSRRTARATRPARPAPVSDQLAAEGSGVLSDRDFYNTIDAWGGLKSCLSSTPAVGEGKGALRVAFQVSTSGEVLNSKAFGATSERAKAISNCVERSARQIRFASFEAKNRQHCTKIAKFVF